MTPDDAQAALADVDDAQRAVRDTPWPVWLYPVNSVLLTLMGLTFLVDDRRPLPTFAVAAAVFAVNLWAGRRMGVPYALPTSKLFLGSVVLAGALLVGAIALAGTSLEYATAATVACSIAAGVVYALGSWAHYRSVRR